MRFFLTAQERTKKRNEKKVAELALAVDARKKVFRGNAISKLTFLYPDMEFAIGMTSDQFAGYSHKSSTFVTGEFFDKFLPTVSRLRGLVEQEDFDTHADEFARDIKDLTFEINSEFSSDFLRQDHVKRMRQYLHSNGDRGYIYDERFYPYDVRIKKNGRLVGRSTTHSPKPVGYFAEKIYEHVVEDIRGSMVSNFTIELFLWNYGDLIEQEIAFSYVDMPRKSASQMRDHYTKTCAQFTPFLQAIELRLHDQYWQHETSAMGFIEEDRALGLR
jgi:hypothetical protein